VVLWMWSVFAVPPAMAAPEPDYRLAGETYAGSQIARYEGVSRAVESRDDTTAASPADAGAGVMAVADTTGARDDLGGPVQGHDVSSHQGVVDWPKAWAAGARFVYVKATEGTGYVNPRFSQQYNGSYQVGMLRGAYHFARPDVSGGAAQANYFVDHGGGWSPDGRTLPGAVDIEYNPYGQVCYGLDPVAMSLWLRAFSDTYRARTGQFPVIYTSTAWWNRCTGGNTGFGPNNPLWVAHFSSSLGPLPAGWTHQMIWQFADKGALPGDQNVFNGPIGRLRDFALDRRQV